MLLQGQDVAAWPWSSSFGMDSFLLASGLGHDEFRTAGEEGNLAGSSDLWSSNSPPSPPAPPACSAVGFQGEIQVFSPGRVFLGSQWLAGMAEHSQSF